MNICNVCQNPSTTRCSKCRQIYYCSRECQKKDWKVHKKLCGKNEVPMPSFPSGSSLPSSLPQMTEFLTDMMFKIDKNNPLENWNVPDFGKEYATKYPHENVQIEFLNSAKSSLKSLQIVERFLDSDLDEPDPNHLMKRWNEFSKELINFLSAPRKFGDIFTGKTKNPYVGDKGRGALSFSNTPKQSLLLDQGKTHVAIGFVDLDLLLRARIVQNKNSVEQPNKFIGYEGSVYAVAKSNVIKEMMTKKAPIQSIIEFWTSSVWTRETLKHFENAVKIVLQYGNAPNNKPPNPTKKELHPKVRSLISHWNESVRNPKSRQEAHELWVKTFNSESGIFSVVANLIESRDRVQVARHILTGEFPLMDDQQKNNLIASITMFNCNDGISPHSTSEFMSQMMPMDAILLKNKRKETSFLNAIYDFFENSITKICTWLSPPAENSVSIEIYLHYQTVTNDNAELLASIRQLDPWTMSWSNICDYFYAHDFHKLLRACSGNDTVHVMTSMNWITEVFGAHIMEYESKYRREIYESAQKTISMTGKFIDPSGYFRYDKVITNPYNIGDVGAASMVKESWKNYFFEGQDLNVGEVSSLAYTQTHKTHTLLNICYTFNKDINVYTEITC
ncbi:hypothetical protein GLOIN_2v1587334 [Rhizophagus irregularis DAOM 181602=DAOM 197198]|uniref:MYND-type domain-containing protein n=3 Tax=Rhizophagus irregularis TaxID=588596 RepID=A0A015LH62_RHIIW|nr:hypothetical protein GLOIN_2v1587334 [Rhizophagus irregularis DAOM 181602=DAOM 197198]EXX54183.1 hypothetical protein RirG_237040 [Rhizophagus irregularis DAOM 197198w]POG73372.1 hypothetical protein GLOIN_2v1587334 [Rhizophagus irregularis DAOM 181602=DAOM 197198]|eukprot:XP_025180238.1 hypothetical protein GLOIN_2v1587334 [Rhizophagus irregularis DAOM 181602=DAOM 197198]